jgi:hypothetical protein
MEAKNQGKKLVLNSIITDMVLVNAIKNQSDLNKLFSILNLIF